MRPLALVLLLVLCIQALASPFDWRIKDDIVIDCYRAANEIEIRPLRDGTALVLQGRLPSNLYEMCLSDRLAISSQDAYYLKRFHMADEREALEAYSALLDAACSDLDYDQAMVELKERCRKLIDLLEQSNLSMRQESAVVMGLFTRVGFVQSAGVDPIFFSRKIVTCQVIISFFDKMLRLRDSIRATPAKRSCKAGSVAVCYFVQLPSEVILRLLYDSYLSASELAKTSRLFNRLLHPAEIILTAPRHTISYLLANRFNSIVFNCFFRRLFGQEGKSGAVFMRLCQILYSNSDTERKTLLLALGSLYKRAERRSDLVVIAEILYAAATQPATVEDRELRDRQFYSSVKFLLGYAYADGRFGRLFSSLKLKLVFLTRCYNKRIHGETILDMIPFRRDMFELYLKRKIVESGHHDY